MLERLTRNARGFRLGSAIFAGAAFAAIGVLVFRASLPVAAGDGAFFALLQYFVIAPDTLRHVREREARRQRT